jgi:hypothetical protein
MQINQKTHFADAEQASLLRRLRELDAAIDAARNVST